MPTTGSPQASKAPPPRLPTATGPPPASPPPPQQLAEAPSATRPPKPPPPAVKQIPPKRVTDPLAQQLAQQHAPLAQQLAQQHAAPEVATAGHVVSQRISRQDASGATVEVHLTSSVHTSTEEGLAAASEGQQRLLTQVIDVVANEGLAETDKELLRDVVAGEREKRRLESAHREHHGTDARVKTADLQQIADAAGPPVRARRQGPADDAFQLCKYHHLGRNRCYRGRECPYAHTLMQLKASWEHERLPMDVHMLTSESRARVGAYMLEDHRLGWKCLGHQTCPPPPHNASCLVPPHRYPMWLTQVLARLVIDAPANMEAWFASEEVQRNIHYFYCDEFHVEKEFHYRG